MLPYEYTSDSSNTKMPSSIKQYCTLHSFYDCVVRKKNIKEIFPAKIGRIRCSASVCVCLRERADEKGFERHLVHCSCLGPEYRNPFIRRGREGGKKGGKEGAHWLKWINLYGTVYSSSYFRTTIINGDLTRSYVYSLRNVCIFFLIFATDRN